MRNIWERDVRGGDSDVMVEWDRVFKLYKNSLQYSDLTFYHKIQNLLSKKTKRITLNKWIAINNIFLIKNIVFSFLKLDSNIYSYSNKKHTWFCSDVPYCQGDNLYDVWSWSVDETNELLKKIKEYIIKELNIDLWLKDSNKYPYSQVNPINIKVVRIDNEHNTMYLTITDFCNDIPEFILRNKDLVWNVIFDN